MRLLINIDIQTALAHKRRYDQCTPAYYDAMPSITPYK